MQGVQSRDPGTGTSDSIPAMLSDGEFVMTAKAVRGMGDGEPRKGAAKMYQLMNRLEGEGIMSTQTTIQETRLQPYQEEMQKDIFASAKALMKEPMATVDYDTFIAERDPLLIEAETMGKEGIGAYQPLLDKAETQTDLAADYFRQQAEAAKLAGGQFDPSGIEQFMNPYERLVLDPALQRIREQQLESENLARHRLFNLVLLVVLVPRFNSKRPLVTSNVSVRKRLAI